MDMKFENGSIIEGKNLKGLVLCKILPDDMKTKEFQYKMGENVDVNPLSMEGSCQTGLHFTDISFVLRFWNFGTKIAFIRIPDNEKVYVENYTFRTHRLIVESVMALNSIDTWKYLMDNGLDVITKHKYAICRVAEKGYLDVLKYLHEQNADLAGENNQALITAAMHGHLEVIKYLQENGADIKDCKI